MKNYVTNCFVQQILKCFKDRIWNCAKNKIKPLFYSLQLCVFSQCQQSETRNQIEIKTKVVMFISSKRAAFSSRKSIFERKFEQIR